VHDVARVPELVRGETRVELDGGIDRAGKDEESLRVPPPERRECLKELRDALALIQVPEAADDWMPAADELLERAGGRVRPRGMRHPPERALVAALADAALDVAGVDDEPFCERENLADEGKALRRRLPQGGYRAVGDAVREQAAHRTGVLLERAGVALPVTFAEGHLCDEVVEYEVVQDDEARLPAKTLEDPPVGLG
jgi:hypothetical protein